MPDSNILQFPTRGLPELSEVHSDVLLAKIGIALNAMKELHAELERLKAMLKAESAPATE